MLAAPLELSSADHCLSMVDNLHITLIPIPQSLLLRSFDEIIRTALWEIRRTQPPRYVHF